MYQKFPRLKLLICKNITIKYQLKLLTKTREKIHEVMVPRTSSHHALEFKDYVIAPEFEFVKHKNFKINNKGETGKLPHSFEYNSLNNPDYLKIFYQKNYLSRMKIQMLQ